MCAMSQAKVAAKIAAKPQLARAVAAFDAEQEGDLGFTAGEVIVVTDTQGDDTPGGGWWTGHRQADVAKTGDFPSNFVQREDDDGQGQDKDEQQPEPEAAADGSDAAKQAEDLLKEQEQRLDVVARENYGEASADDAHCQCDDARDQQVAPGRAGRIAEWLVEILGEGCCDAVHRAVETRHRGCEDARDHESRDPSW